MDYITLDRDLKIQDISLAVQRFADLPQEVQKGKDVRNGFPEFVGIEDVLKAIFDGKMNSFELKGIRRSSKGDSPLYVDICVFGGQNEINSTNKVYILFEDVTEKMLLEQSLSQTIHESSLLASRLSRYKEYVDKILDSMTDILLVTTESGSIKTVNKAAKDLLGYSESDLINQQISTVIVSDLAGVKKNAAGSNNKDLFKDIELVCKTKTGEEIVLAFSLSIIETELQDLYNFVYIGRDISNRKQNEEEMRYALEKQKQVSELKFRFFSMVTHEFGNPLNIILMSLALLEHYGKESTEEENLEYIQNIKTAANQMTALLKDILVINKAEAGKLKFSPQPLDIVKYCYELVEEIKLSAGGDRQIIFDCKEDAGVEESITSFLPCLDGNLLRHILANLLSNAVKYSPKNSTVYFELICHTKQVIFKIKDEGIGISLEDQQRLFELFHRGKNVGKIPGTGLGLSIVKQALDLHGGKIVVNSEVDIGTTFIITIPLS